MSWDFPEFIRALPELDIDLKGVSGHLMQAGPQQVAFVRFDEDVEVPEHSHRAQWELVVAGEVHLRLEGEEHRSRPGDAFYIPAGVPHSATVKSGYRAVIFFDQPDRYRAR